MLHFKQFNSVALTAFLLCILGGLAVTNSTKSPFPAVVGGLIVSISSSRSRL
jgi:hypothetical protein